MLIPLFTLIPLALLFGLYRTKALQFAYKSHPILNRLLQLHSFNLYLHFIIPKLFIILIIRQGKSKGRQLKEDSISFRIINLVINYIIHIISMLSFVN